MARSEPIADDSCGLQRGWLLDAGLADMLVELEARLQRVFSAEGFRWPGLYIISGHRSSALQNIVNPTVEDSKHERCPSLAADLRVGNEPASTTPRLIWEIVGSHWMEMGGRWGGVFADRDLNHFEVGL